MEITRENAGDKLSDFFIDHIVTQKKLAAKTNVSENTVSGILNGRKPDSMTVKKINRYLKQFNDK